MDNDDAFTSETASACRPLFKLGIGYCMLMQYALKVWKACKRLDVVNEEVTWQANMETIL